MIVFTIIGILIYLGTGVFTMLNWQTVDAIWAQPIVFILGCISFICAGVLIEILIELIIMNKEDNE